MPPYEPKTDSKEFEIADSAREASPRNEAVSDSADLTIRLWNPDRSAAGSVTWKTESVLVYMIADLVTASHGQVNESSPSMTAHFDSIGRALVAARRIQTAILEFLGCRPGNSVAATILIHLPPTTPGGYSAGMAQAALRLAEPGQILVADELARHMHDMPGIELRAVPALTTGGGEQSGLAELLWASAEEMARLKALLNSGQPREESAPMGATMIVNAPLGMPATNKTALAGGATGSAAAATSSRMTGDLAAGRNSTFKDLEDAEPTPLLTRTRVILGAAAVVLVAALVWFFYPSRLAKSPAPPAPATQVGGAEVPSSPTPQPVQPPSVQPSASEPARPPVATTKPAKPLVEKHGKDKAAAGTTPIPEPQPVQSVEGMTQNDIPGLLQMAKSDAGSGNYEKARREYRIILQLQPSNSEAREGMRRLDIAQSDR